MRREDLAPAWLGVAGRPIGHSLSPVLHEAGLAALGRPGASFAVDVGPTQFSRLLEWLHPMAIAGLNVTAPHKEAALRLASSATAAARAAGSANCLRPTERGFEATNTDGDGFVAFLAEAGIPVESRAVVLLGGGGAAAGLAPALAGAGARLAVVARRPERAGAYAGLAGLPRAAWESEEASRWLATADLVVHATPLGRQAGDPLPCRPEILRSDVVAVDLHYGPAASPWVAALRASRRRAFDGLGLLVHQCALSFHHWFSETPPLARLREAVSCPPLEDS